MSRFRMTDTVFYGLLAIVDACVMAVIATLGGGVRDYLLVLLGSVCACLIYHHLTFAPKSPVETAAVQTAGSWNDLFTRESGSLAPPPLKELIAQASDVFILGGTLKSFTDDESNLTALRRLREEGKRVRILLLNPDGEACRQRERDRLSAKRPDADQAQEALLSVARIVFGLRITPGDPAEAKSILRWYDALPHNAIYKLGTTYVINMYRFGRGRSSPALIVERTRRHAAFCDALDRGFDDLWNAERTIAVPVQEVLDRGVRPGRGEERRPRRTFAQYSQPMGLRPNIDLDKAVGLAATFEDEEIVRRMERRT